MTPMTPEQQKAAFDAWLQERRRTRTRSKFEAHAAVVEHGRRTGASFQEIAAFLRDQKGIQADAANLKRWWTRRTARLASQAPKETANA